MLRTKTQTVELCSNCPTAKTANLIGDSVVLLILRDMFSGPQRFKDMTTSLAGVSSRTLTQKLKMLEESEIIVRKEYAEKPPRVEYTLSKKGKGLQKIIDAMRLYGEKYLSN